MVLSAKEPLESLENSSRVVLFPEFPHHRMGGETSVFKSNNDDIY
jgi:hypothetical protein